MELEFALELHLAISSMREMGAMALGSRRMQPISGGHFEGPGIKGVIEPGGADWQLIRKDGIIEFDARYTLHTDDGAYINIMDKGLRHGPPEVMQKLVQGERINPATYYFRSSPSFETTEGKYDWLMKSVFVASGERNPKSITIKVFKVL